MKKLYQIILIFAVTLLWLRNTQAYTVTVFDDGFVYQCSTFEGTHEVDISSCTGYISEININCIDCGSGGITGGDAGDGFDWPSTGSGESGGGGSGGSTGSSDDTTLLEPKDPGRIVGPCYDIDKAINHLNSHAHGSSQGACSRYVHNAIIAGGIVAAETQPVVRGGAYGPLLEKWGFKKVNTTGYTPMKGDIAVIEGYPGGTICGSCGCPCGHIQMYNGTQWVSDFFQPRPFWPGREYDVHKPPYEIFRW